MSGKLNTTPEGSKTASISSRRRPENTIEAKTGPSRSKLQGTRFQDDLKFYLKEYSKVTDVHGVRYMCEDRSRLEKIFWWVLFIISVISSIYMILHLLARHQTSPVIVSYSATNIPNYQIPFPAVTFCTETKARKSIIDLEKVYQLVRNKEQLNDFENLTYSYLYQLCDHDPVDLPYGHEYLNEDFFRNLDYVKPEFEKLMIECEFMGRKYKCEELFKPVLTAEGICYTFNMLNRSDLFKDHVTFSKGFYDSGHAVKRWGEQTGYEEGADEDVYPRRALIAGASNALILQLGLPIDDMDKRCKSFLKGFRILLHNPIDVPRLTKHYFRVPLDTLAMAGIRPRLIVTEPSAMRFPPEVRKCYMEMERPLKHFKIYTQKNCHFECVVNYTLQKCGCVDFFMPRDRDTKICGSAKYKCLFDAERELELKELQSSLRLKLKAKKRDKKQLHSLCDCMPLCTDLTYESETMSTFWNWKAFHTFREELQDINTTTKSRIYIYFKAFSFKKIERTELFGVFDLIASLGGIIGLFTGISIITLAEMFYYFSLRIFCNRRLYGPWIGASRPAP